MTRWKIPACLGVVKMNDFKAMRVGLIIIMCLAAVHIVCSFIQLYLIIKGEA